MPIHYLGINYAGLHAEPGWIRWAQSRDDGTPATDMAARNMDKILFVDDDPQILAIFQAMYRKEFAIETAVGASQGLTALESGDVFAAVVADMMMPGMDGIEFLLEARKRSPDTVRIMLTGNFEQGTAAQALNDAGIFMFLNKPCPPDRMHMALQAAVREHERAVRERELLEKTFKGCVEVLSEILSLVDAKSFGESRGLAGRAVAMARAVGLEPVWEIEVAALLYRIGNVSVPRDVAYKSRQGTHLSEVERSMMAEVPEVGSRLLRHLPRLENVSRIILYQQKRFDGSGYPLDRVAGTDIPAGARLLKILNDLILLEGRGYSREATIERLRARSGWYDPDMLEAIAKAPWSSEPSGRSTEVRVRVESSEIEVGQILLSNVETQDGMVLVHAGTTVTSTLLQRLTNFSAAGDLKEPIQVLIRH